MKNHSNCKNLPPFTDCQLCTISLLCLPITSCTDQQEWLSQGELHLDKNKTLFQAQQTFSTLYLVKSGALKAFSLEASGKERVLGFYLPGEIIGLEAIAYGRHPFSIQALAKCHLCRITFASLREKIQHQSELQLKLLQLASAHLNTGHCLRYARAEQRIVSFLIELGQRLAHSPGQSFALPISRQAMADYLGLAPETVIRLMSRLQQLGYLRIDHKHIQFVDLDKLEAILAGHPL